MESGSRAPQPKRLGGGGDRVLGRAPVFLPLGLLHPARVAAEADYVVVVGDGYEAVARAEALKSLGVEVLHYPLSSLEAPTIYSLLGAVGVLLGELEKGSSVIVEGDTGLLEAAYLVSVTGDTRAPRRLARRMTSPLHYRLAVALVLLAEAGLDLSSEALRYKGMALVGGDAQKSDDILHAADLEYQLGLRGLAARLYLGRNPESPAAEVIKALRGDGSGAANVIALGRSGRRVNAFVGCRLLLHEHACSPEAQALQDPLAELLASRGLSLSRIEQVDPLEAACIAYPSYPCE